MYSPPSACCPLDRLAPRATSRRPYPPPHRLAPVPWRHSVLPADASVIANLISIYVDVENDFWVYSHIKLNGTLFARRRRPLVYVRSLRANSFRI